MNIILVLHKLQCANNITITNFNKLQNSTIVQPLVVKKFQNLYQISKFSCK
jgi:hypothetical protein